MPKKPKLKDIININVEPPKLETLHMEIGLHLIVPAGYKPTEEQIRSLCILMSHAGQSYIQTLFPPDTFPLEMKVQSH